MREPSSQAKSVPPANEAGGVQISGKASAIKIAPMKIIGRRRPHLVRRLSEMLPAMGSVKAS